MGTTHTKSRACAWKAGSGNSLDALRPSQKTLEGSPLVPVILVLITTITLSTSQRLKPVRRPAVRQLVWILFSRKSETAD